MQQVLDALEAQIAEAQAYVDDLTSLRDRAEELAAARRAKRPEAPPGDPPAPSELEDPGVEPPAEPDAAGASRASTNGHKADAGQRAADVLELLRRQGPLTQADIAATTGWNRDAVTKALKALENGEPPVAQRTGRTLRAAGKTVGRPSPEWEALSSPEPPAGAASTEPPAQPTAAAPAATTLDDDVAATDEDLDQAPDVGIELEDYADARPKRAWAPDGEARRALERMAQFCDLEPKAIREFVSELGITRATVMRILQHSHRFEQYGERRFGKTTQPVYRPVPLPHERPDVTIRQADRTGSVEGRVLAQLQASRLTIEQLATRLVLHPRLVAEAVSALAREGDVEKLPGGVWALTEGAAV